MAKRSSARQLAGSPNFRAEPENEVIELLSVSPIQQDHDTLASFLGRDQWRIHICATAVKMMKAES